MREENVILQDMLVIARKSENGEISSKELFESYEPLICELTHSFRLSRIEIERLHDEAVSNVNITREALEEIQTYDMAVRASYNFVIDKGYEEEFKAYFKDGLDDVSAKIRRSEFELIKPN